MIKVHGSVESCRKDTHSYFMLSGPKEGKTLKLDKNAHFSLLWCNIKHQISALALLRGMGPKPKVARAS
jgi:hypothetical protein